MVHKTSHLTVQGMRARDLDLQIGPLTLITGPMGSCKTTAADALRFLALGYVPALGKSEGATAALIRGQELGVQLGLADGRTLTRGLARKAKGIKGNAVASWLEKAKPSEHGDALLHLFGADKESAAEHLDLRRLIHATPNQRAARLEGLLAATAMGPGETLDWLLVLATCRMARQERIPDDLESAKALAGGLRHGLSDAEGLALDAVFGELQTVFGELGMAGALDRAGEIRRTEATSTKQGRAARTKIEDRRAGMTIPTETITALEAGRDKATADQATLEERVRAFQSGGEERREAAQAVTDASAVLSTLAEMTPDAQAAKAESARLSAEAKGIAIPDAPSALVLPEIHASFQPAIDEAERLAREHAAKDREAEPGRPDPLVPELTGHLQENVREAEEALLSGGNDPWEEVRWLAGKLTTWAEGTDEAAGLHQMADGLRTLASENGVDLAALRKALREAVAILDSAKTRNDDLRRGHEAHLGDWENAHAAWLEAETAAAAARLPLQTAIDEARADKRTTEEGLREERQRLTALHEADQRRRRDALSEREIRVQRSASALKRWTDHQRAVTDATAAKGAAGARVAGMAIVQEVDLEEAATQVADLALAVAGAQESIDALQAADVLDREMGDLAAQIKRGEVRLEAAKGMEHGLHALRERDLAERGKPLTDRLRAFLHAAGLGHVEPYVRAGPRSLDFGWVRGANRPVDVPLQAMSGGETVMFMAGMAAAVIAIRAPEIRLLLIEGAECQDHLGSLMAGCAAVSEEITHTIITTQRAPETIDAAWTHLTLGEPSPAAAPATP